VRLVVRRVRPTPGSQLALFTTWDYHAFVTNRLGDVGEIEADHRRHAVVEQRIAELKSAGLAHLPSGKPSRPGPSTVRPRWRRGPALIASPIRRGAPCPETALPLAEPGRGDHRGAGRRGQGRELGVDALDAGVAVRGALLVMRRVRRSRAGPASPRTVSVRTIRSGRGAGRWRLRQRLGGRPQSWTAADGSSWRGRRRSR